MTDKAAAETGYRLDNSTDGWVGNGLMRGGKGYVPTSGGQIHYRMVGSGGTPMLLLHQTPWSLSQYAGVQPALAGHGVASLAVDTPGFGMSDAPAERPTIPSYVAAFVEALDQLGLAKVVVAGHHTGATFAASLAADYPDRVAGVVLHGSPLMDAAEREKRLANPPYQRPVRKDGSHFGEKFNSIQSATDENPQNLITTTWSVINFYLSGATDAAYPAVFSHDMEKDLLAIRAPALILTDERDGLHAKDRLVHELRPDFRYQVFSPNSAHAFTNEPERWANIVAGFVKEITP